jgi:uncharacterized tellurite resistance protein B-like protein
MRSVIGKGKRVAQSDVRARTLRGFERPGLFAMLNAIRRFFDQNIASKTNAPPDEHRLQVATAALLAEVMRLDGQAEPERRAVLNAVQRRFGLSDDEAHTLVDLAETQAREAVDYYQFTSLINRAFSAEQKVHIVELMWQVVYADATLSAHEHHVMRKIADLLYVSHGDYIAAKLRAKETAGS